MNTDSLLKTFIAFVISIMLGFGITKIMELSTDPLWIFVSALFL